MQPQTFPIQSDEIEKGQTVIFCLQGVCHPIYGRVLEKGETESKVMTFEHREKMTVSNVDMARRVMERPDLYAMIKQCSPEMWG